MHLVIGLLASTLLARKKQNRPGSGALSFWGTLEVQHELPGRIRFHCPVVREDATASKLLEKELPRLPGVTDVGSDSRSGSIVVRYEPGRIDMTTIQAGVLKLLNLETAADSPAPAALTRETAEIINAINQALLDRTKGAVDLDFLIPTALMTYAAIKSLGGSKSGLSAGFTLLWWAWMYMSRTKPEERS